MSHQVIWDDDTLQFFISKARLNESQEYIMRSRCTGTPRTVQAQHEHISMATLDRRIKRIKIKYDALQKKYPDVLPQRKESAEQLYMDTH